MFVCTTVLYKSMKSFRNAVHNFFHNTHVQSKIYLEFNHGIVHIANEGCHIRINSITPY
jgi:hypothetical protein